MEHVAALSHGDPLPPDLRVDLHFHPDVALDGIVRDGGYRSQFETGTSNGGLTAHPGGDRWRWESRLFGGVYDHAPPAERPKYGALNHRRRPEGGAIRFGSAHLRLTARTLARTTFCYPDSVFEPVDFGVAHRMSLTAMADADDRDRLDDYVEAHVHGPVRLDRDVEALVLDPCFRGTEVEVAAGSLPVEWHQGFRLAVADLDVDYRGPEAADLARELAVDGFLDARILGLARGDHDPQMLKRVWHLVARFG